MTRFRAKGTSNGAADRVGAIDALPGMPSPDEVNAIRSAIAQGRRNAAVRLLREVNPRGEIRHESWGWLSESAPPDKVIPVALQISKRGHHDFAAAILAGVDYQDASLDLKRSVGRALDHGGQHELAISVFRDLIASGDRTREEYTEEMRVRDAHRLGLAELHLAANKLVAEVPCPTGRNLKGFVVIYNVDKVVLTGLMVPLVGPLMQQGFAVAAVTRGNLKTQPCGIPDFDNLQGSVAPDGKSLNEQPRHILSQEWRVDWESGIVEAGGINYFPYFQERLSQRARRYKANILNDPESAERFVAQQLKADVALTTCGKVLTLAKYKKPIRIAVMDSHFSPQGIIREWCDQVGRTHGIHTVALSVGYENYFSNLTTLEATTLAVEDLTAQPELRQPFLGGPHRLKVALRENSGLATEPDDEVMSWVCQNRSKVGESSQARDYVLATAHEVHLRGGKVFVALGKVSIDFAAPGDRGFAHADFVSWINHLIQAVTGTDNLLLIKPHPHELREEIVVEGVQLLRELVVPVLPRNVLFLEHDSFNTHELADVVDAAFLWNGTAALEFSVLGVPVVPASIWAVRDYPVGLQVLRSREEYEEALQGKRVLPLADGVKRRAAMFLRLMRSDHVAMPYKYFRRAATNMKIGTPVFHLDSLLELESTPDPYVERALLRFFEFS